MKFVPIEKMSKRQRKAENDRHRASWNGVVPVTKIVPDGRRYDRNRMKRELLRGA